MKAGIKYIVGSICLLSIFAFVWGTVTGDWFAYEKVDMAFFILTGIFLGQYVQFG